MNGNVGGSVTMERDSDSSSSNSLHSMHRPATYGKQEPNIEPLLRFRASLKPPQPLSSIVRDRFNCGGRSRISAINTIGNVEAGVDDDSLSKGGAGNDRNDNSEYLRKPRPVCSSRRQPLPKQEMCFQQATSDAKFSSPEKTRSSYMTHRTKAEGERDRCESSLTASTFRARLERQLNAITIHRCETKEPVIATQGREDNPKPLVFEATGGSPGGVSLSSTRERLVPDFRVAGGASTEGVCVAKGLISRVSEPPFISGKGVRVVKSCDWEWEKVSVDWKAEGT